ALQPAELRRRTIVSGLAVLIARTSQAIVSLGAAIVLARLLMPDDFGVFAMVVPLGIIATGLSGRCFQTALLQCTTLTEDDLNTFFRFAVRMNLFIAASMLVAGVALSRFFGEPRVIGVAAMWAALVFLLSLTTFQEALLKRRLLFPRITLVQLLALVLGVAAAVTAARQGAGYWSLPIQLLVTEVTRAVGIFVLSDWRPRWVAHYAPNDVIELRRAWRALGGLNLAGWLNEQPDLLAVGRVGGATVLGYYDMARRWSWYPFEEPFLSLSDLAVSSLSKVQSDAARFTRVATRAVLATLTVSMPAIAFAAADTASLVKVLLGDQWLPAIPYMRLLCVVALFGSLARVTQWIHLSRGNAARLVRWSLFAQTPTVAVAALIGYRWGALGVATAMAIATSVLALPAVAYAVRGSPITFRVIIGVAARPLVTSVSAALIVAIVGAKLGGSPGASHLALTSIVFGTAFAAVWLALPGGVDSARSLMSAFREFRPPVARIDTTA
ncbi:MAG: oligosaccharide flippase family protein, partial [Gemmatimonas sp.]